MSNAEVEGDSLAAVWQEYAPELRERCRFWMGEPADAEEAFSRATTHILLHLSPSSRTILDLRSWLLRLTYNVCMDLHRERKRRREESLEDLCGAGADRIPALVAPGDPEQQFLQSELKSYLMRRIWSLPKHFQEPILRRAARQSYREIADALGIREPNARKRVQTAREILCQALHDYRTGRVSTVRPVAGSRPDSEAEATVPPEREWGLRALRPVVVHVQGIEIDVVLPLCSSPQRLSSRRLQAAQRYLEQHPHGWRGALRVARLLRESGRLVDAIPYYRSVVERAPRRIEIRFELASSLELSGRRQEALTVYGEALRWARGEVEILYLRALEAGCRGDGPSMEAHLTRALERAPGDPTLLAIRAEGRWRAGRPAEVIEDVGTLLEQSPDDEIGLTRGHDALTAAGWVREASRRSCRAAEIHASVSGLGQWIVHRCRAGQVWGQEGKKTHQLLGKLLRLDGLRAETHACLARYHLARGEQSQAEEALERFLVRHPRQGRGWAEKARALFRMGRYADAGSSIRRALELAPGREAWLLACRILPWVASPAEVLSIAEQSLRRFPDDWLATTAAARALAGFSAAREPALELALQATRLQPRLPESWFLYGSLLQRWTGSREAVALLEEGWRLLPAGDGFLQSTPAALLRAECLRDLGDTGGSLVWYRHALDHAHAARAIDPALALTWEARAHLGLGEPQAARQALSAALRTGLLHPLRQIVETALDMPVNKLSQACLRTRLEE